LIARGGERALERAVGAQALATEPSLASSGVAEAI